MEDGRQDRILGSGEMEMEDGRQDGILGSRGRSTDIMIFLSSKVIFTHGWDSNSLGVLDNNVSSSPRDEMISARESRRRFGVGLTLRDYTDLLGDEVQPERSAS